MNKLTALVLAAATVGCGGGSSSTPTAPSAASAPALTTTAVAPTLAAEINSAFIAAMRSGVPVASRDRDARPDYLTLVIEMFIGVPLHAQGGFVANCSSGGNVRVQSLGAAPGGGRVTLANTPVTFSSCAHSLNGRNVVAIGTLMANGSWTASEPTSPVRLSGDLTVNEIGIVAIDGATGSNFIGAVGGISIGVADTPPPPNPTPPVCPTPVPTPACPAPAPAPPAPAPPAPTPPAPTPPAPTPPAPTPPAPTPPAPTPPAPTPTPTPTPVNITGTWLAGADRFVITQTGSGIGGTVLLSQTGGLTITSSVLTGSVSGNNVNMTLTMVGLVRAEGLTVTTTSISIFSMILTSSTAMSGPVATTATAVCAGSEFCPAPTTTSSNSSTSLTKQ